MSGAPAYQGSSYQKSAFQAGSIVVAADYALASPAFAKPTLGVRRVLTVSAYSLASLSFATPQVRAVSALQKPATYSLGSPVFDRPSVRSASSFVASAYSLGSPSFARPILGQRVYLRANAMSLAPLAFSKPHLALRYSFLAAAYSTGSPSFATVNLGSIFPVMVDSYSLSSLSFGYPRLQWWIDPTRPVMPPSYLTQVEEAAEVLKQLMNYVLMSIPPGITPATNNVRRLASTVRDHAAEYIRGTTLGTQLSQVFLAADVAGATFGGIDAARLYLMNQAASKSIFTQIVYRSALVMVMALESNIVARMTFTNQEQCQNMVMYMRQAFEDARALGIDEVDALVYQTLTALGGAIMNHLGRTELKLPRYVTWRSVMPMPSLYLAQRIYADGSRSDEIEAENRIVHPAFCQTQLRVLNNPPVGR
jgi:hypothetical protein